MKILGIDPGTRITGYGIVEQRGHRLLHVDNGVFVTRSDQGLAERLKIIYDGLCRVIALHRPEAVAVEQIFLSSNALSALKLGHARGTVLLAAINAGLSPAEYTALQVKSAVVGYGRATKPQVQQMVKTLLALPEIAQEDASDALAVAICHAHSYSLRHKIPPASRRRAAVPEQP